MKYSGYLGHETKNIMNYFLDVVFNPFDTGFHLLSPGSILASFIREKRINEFSWNFQDTLDMRQETIDN